MQISYRANLIKRYPAGAIFIYSGPKIIKGEFYNLIHCKSNEYAYICSSKLAKISNAKANIQNTR